jgi:hypothetical protein
MEIVAVHGHIKNVMKRALTLVLTGLALAFPLAAEDTKPASTTTTAAAAEPDSPLVAAAKKANRRGKKPKILITNENLKSSGANAHVTTAAKQTDILMPKPLDPPRPTPEMAAARAQEHKRKLAEEAAAEKKKTDEARDEVRAAKAGSAEEGLYDDEDHDPAKAEREQQEANQQKPPQF